MTNTCVPIHTTSLHLFNKTEPNGNGSSHKLTWVVHIHHNRAGGRSASANNGHKENPKVQFIWKGRVPPLPFTPPLQSVEPKAYEYTPAGTDTVQVLECYQFLIVGQPTFFLQKEGVSWANSEGMGYMQCKCPRSSANCEKGGRLFYVAPWPPIVAHCLPRCNRSQNHKKDNGAHYSK